MPIFYNWKNQLPDSGYAILRASNWDDWFKWETLFQLSYYDMHGKRHDIGALKIASPDSDDFEEKKPRLRGRFDRLPPQYFSLGQDDSYYMNLMKLPRNVGIELLRNLNDVVLDQSRFRDVENLEVARRSLLRNVSETSVRGQFKRIIDARTGDQSLSAFDVRFCDDTEAESKADVTLRFSVVPESLPPSNIHVLIGRNGSGKTRLLQRMARSLITGDSGWGHWVAEGGQSAGDALAGVGLFSFSAFDQYPLLSEYDSSSVNFFEVSLKKDVFKAKPEGGNSPGGESASPRDVVPSSVNESEVVTYGDSTEVLEAEDMQVSLKSARDIANDMARAVYLCEMKSKDRWLRAVALLESDPIFASIGASNFIDNRVRKVNENTYQFKGIAAKKWAELSSGHKIALLTVTELVARLEERTVVLFDEPEGHLHPPLLSALVRAISLILTEKNAFAIIATHSPVVLQEVPRPCVFRVLHTVDGTRFSPIEMESFGESVGGLTRAVFGLEVDASGFHKLIDDELLRQQRTVSEMAALFGGHLGSEALAQIYANARLDRAAVAEDLGF